MGNRAVLWALIACFSALLAVVTAEPPYHPTRILRNGTTIYVFRTQDTSSQFELGAFDIASTVTAARVPYRTLSPSLPFLDSNKPRAFTPVMQDGGHITVYAGDCTSGVQGAEVWTYAPEVSGQGGDIWEQQKLLADDIVEESASSLGPNYLGGGMAFSTLVDRDAANSVAYFFGGMCPNSDSAGDWQSSADYSNQIVVLDPSQQMPGGINFKARVSSSRGPPIPEAGFTLTGLSPSFSNRSDGSQTQQQDFVLVGGHTSTAFINMSQVALFSLPQESWTFLPVLQPDPERTDLTIRTDVQGVEPRSGHTAVLSPDGQRIIVFGGWIGDINTPANPQLAVLNIGQGFGGTGDWEWTVPVTSGDGLPGDAGLYGHGAVMLPGGVMMVTGGYSMQASNSRRRRRSVVPNSKTLFYNITSDTFVTDYVAPQEDASGASPAKSGPLATTSQRAGLGAGLGIGMAAVLTLLLFYLWYTSKLKKQRYEREKQLHELSLGAHRDTLDHMSPGPAARYLPESREPYLYNPVPKTWREAHGQDVERTGLLVEIPSPTRGLRRSLGGRGHHHMARYDERRVQGSGHIHPIDELEEEEQEQDRPSDTNGPISEKTPLNTAPEMGERNHNRVTILDNMPVLDPFVDKDMRSENPSYAPMSPDLRTQSFTSNHSGGMPTAAEERDSFTTARSSFAQLQAEGEALLGGIPDQMRPTTSSTSNGGSRVGVKSSPPRRAASDASFWRSKRGKEDWEDDELEPSDPRSIWRRNSGDDWGAPEDRVIAERERQKRQWRNRRSINLMDDEIPSPHTPIFPLEINEPERVRTPAAEDEDWDVEAAVERRVVQVMFTVPKSKLRVVNADVERSSILSLPWDKDSPPDSPENTTKEKSATSPPSTPSRSNEDITGPSRPTLQPTSSSSRSTNSSPGPRVRDLVGRFESKTNSPSPSPPRPSPSRFNLATHDLQRGASPSPSMDLQHKKVRGRASQRGLNNKRSMVELEGVGVEGKGERVTSEDITDMR
ncbi:hypothetical protein M011DRAFT_412390 [Sporormia fimetaria CBS 119925]|uniref:Galactose oxidase n=1 Tax=Sporormia fimetaria CBS 119925 TaxID=1340428 RepID=A0A6A6V009_9PLEO|nr:hypothetical protein M011DRAFT_412390 [Sporormia fimetaria CBS 119925]